jgi:hypothetical protein
MNNQQRFESTAGGIFNINKSVWKRPGAARTALALVLVALGSASCAGELEAEPDSFPKAIGSGATGAGAAGMATVAGAGGSGGSGGSDGGSGGGGSSGVPVVPMLTACAQEILSMKCSLCHQPALAASPGFGMLDVSGADVGNRLVNKLATNSGPITDKASCRPGALLIDPVTPSKSVLLERVLGTQSCGAVMPDPPLSDTEKACLQEWIGKFSVAAGNQITLDPDSANGSGGGSQP